MGESACLMRSFSHPSDASREVKEGDPLRALGESISFGRFMSESLAWEKWSSFSQNRYLEEAEKFSKPGSVAQKKAYFEAHYKSIAAKKAAALLEANEAANNAPEPEIVDEIHNTNSMDSESAEMNSNVAMYEQEKETTNTEIVFPVDANGRHSIVERCELENANVEVVEPVIKESVLAENTNRIENSNELERVENQDQIMATLEEKTIVEAVKQEILASKSKKKSAISSLKPPIFSRKSKLPSPAEHTTPIQPRKETITTPNSKRSARHLMDKMRSTPKSLHMSINLTSQAGETSRRNSPFASNKGSSRILTASVRMSKDSSTPRRTPTAVASVNGDSKHLSVTPQLENRRTKTPLDHSFSGSRTTDGKWRSLFLDRLNSSSACVSKARSPTIISSFSFRSEERAAKRKEFFQRLEEKSNAKEAEKVLPQTKSKEKAENDLKKLRQSTGFKDKPTADSYRETESPINPMKKIPPTMPRSPKLGRKPTPSPVQDTSSRPPRWPVVKTDGSKRVVEKNNQTPTRSVTSLPKKNTPTRSVTSMQKKNTHENASPNIEV